MLLSQVAALPAPASGRRGAAPGIPGYIPSAGCTAQPVTTFCTYPSDKWGFAVLHSDWSGRPAYLALAAMPKT